MGALEKESLFISYCWSDGNVYADELEAQLADYFEVKRDKSQLIANDDIRDFMAEIANCDNVLIVLTADYVKSMNCMLEVSYLLQQPDWAYKASLYMMIMCTVNIMKWYTYFFIRACVSRSFAV